MRNPRAQRRATKLRHSPTDAESRIWYFLRRGHLLGFRFRRQVPIGPYIVDFLCTEAALVVEIDGSQHADAMVYDSRRERFLASRGLRVLRFWNTEVLLETEGVIEVILHELGSVSDRTSAVNAGLPPT
jgi:very-short-patch-repair endonuclease